MLAHPAVVQSPLCTRDALYGNRTEDMRLNCNAREGETIQYVDVMTLYPYICKYFKFPVGLSVIHVGYSCKEGEACLRLFGLIKCVVPLESLHHPMLPFRANQKIIFCLCRTCVKTCNTG